MATLRRRQAALPGIRIRPAPRPAPRAVQSSHLWLCVGLPGLALEATTQSDQAPTTPLVVVDDSGKVHAVNHLARQQGVHAGMGLNAAFALCPTLCTRARNSRLEKQKLTDLARWAGRFTPWVSIEPPAALLLEVRGSLALFGGTAALFELIENELENAGHEHRLALAPTPLAALWLARAGQRVALHEVSVLAGALGPLSLRCLQWPQKVIAALAGMGVHTLAQCLRLPRDGFARRFGQHRLTELDQALARHPDPREAFVAPEYFRQRLELDAEIDTTASLLPAARVLTDKLADFLVRRQATVQRLLLRLLHTGAPATHVHIGMLDSSRDPQRLLSLLEVRLERVGLDKPVSAVELVSGRIARGSHGERDLFRRGGVSDWSVLLENLCTRLGADAVAGLTSIAEHRPEAAWQYLPIHQQSTGLQAAVPGRPLWLLPQPQPFNACNDKKVQYQSGPERIESGWWDGSDVSRDYYVVSTSEQQQLWVFRERRAPHNWYLHGLFG